MFIDELSPVVRALIGQPVAFLGGFCSGLLRLDLNDDPVKAWLENQTGVSPAPVDGLSNANGKGKGPQTISID